MYNTFQKDNFKKYYFLPLALVLTEVDHWYLENWTIHNYLLPDCFLDVNINSRNTLNVLADILFLISMSCDISYIYFINFFCPSV